MGLVKFKVIPESPLNFVGRQLVQKKKKKKHNSSGAHSVKPSRRHFQCGGKTLVRIEMWRAPGVFKILTKLEQERQ